MTSHLQNKMNALITAKALRNKKWVGKDWTLKECLAIIDDSAKPVSYRTIRSWASGQVVKVHALPGSRRPKRYGLTGLLGFILAKHLLQEAGLSGAMVQRFIDELYSAGTDEFLTKLGGYFLFVQNDGEDGEVLFFDDPVKFGKASMIFKDYAPRCGSINMPYLVEEMFERLNTWDSRTEYKEPDRGAVIREAFRRIREENLAHGRPQLRSVPGED